MPLRLIVGIYFILEVYLLITIGASLGVFLTLVEFALSFLVGSYFVRLQSLHILSQVRVNINNGQAPELSIMNLVLTIVAGILLMIPGFASDFIAIVLFLPWIKSLLLKKIWLNLSAKAQRNQNKNPVTIDIEKND